MIQEMHNKTYKEYEDKINRRKEMLDYYSAQYSELSVQVKNLDDIHNTLPSWCSTSAGNMAESSRNRDISEQP